MSSKSINPKPDWDHGCALLMDNLLSSDVKVKSAAEVGKRAVEFFRGTDFVRWAKKHKEVILKRHSDILADNRLETQTDIYEIGNKLIKKGFIYRAQYKPHEGTVEQDEQGNSIRPKWPKRLAMTSRQSFEESGFYIISYEGAKTWQHFALFLIIFAVLVLCMFPAWPLKLKLGVWYISVFLMTILLVLVFSRLIIFGSIWFFGYDFWILPNLFNEEASVIDSFLPLLDIDRRNDDWVMFAARIFLAITAAGMCYELSKTHSVSDVGNVARQSLLDVLDWGHQKLASEPANKSSFPSITDIENVVPEEEDTPKEEDVMQQPEEHDIDPEEDFRCLKSCDFGSFEDLVKDCLMECDCTRRIVESECFVNCDEAAKKSLHEAHLDACHEEEERLRRRNNKKGGNSNNNSDTTTTSTISPSLSYVNDDM